MYKLNWGNYSPFSVAELLEGYPEPKEMDVSVWYDYYADKLERKGIDTDVPTVKAELVDYIEYRMR